MHRAAFILLTLVLLATSVRAEVQVELDVQPRVVTLGEAVTCTITMKGDVKAQAPGLPPIKGFEVVSASTRRSVNIVNGHAEQSISYDYQLTPLEAGEFQFGPFEYHLNGQAIPLGPISVKVVDSGAASPGEREQDYLFATLTASPTNIFVQQPIDLVLSLYSREVQLDREISLQGFDGGGLKLDEWRELGAGREQIGSLVYDVRRFRCRATPITAGAFELKPQLRINLLVRQARQRDPFFGSVFDDAFFGRFRQQPRLLDVQPLSLHVRDLPAEGQPAGFAGAVGRFTLDVTAGPANVAVGEPVTVRITISGQGNLETLSAPAMAGDERLRVYEAKRLPDIGGPDTKVYEQVVIPRSPGVTELPALAFSYFDPETARYETLTRGPFPLRVTGEAANAAVLEPAASATARQAERIGLDIVHLKQAPGTWRPLVHGGPARAAAQIALLLPPLVLAGLWLAVNRREALARDPRRSRRLAAPRSARSALRAARAAADGDDPEVFAEAYWRVLADYFGNRLNLDPGQLTDRDVLGRLEKEGFDAPLREDVREAFELCEQLRFGGAPRAGAHTERRNQLDDLELLLQSCERNGP